MQQYKGSLLYILLHFSRLSQLTTKLSYVFHHLKFEFAQN